ncbi:glycosyltransferase [Hymenobacter seoulensis]
MRITYSLPLLSICVPTYRRPTLLARALRSIGPLPPHVELLISDNSPADDWQTPLVAQYALTRQPAAQGRYYRNREGGNSTTNWQACMRRARGRYLLMLHDDDYLLPGGLPLILQTLLTLPKPYGAVLFGVAVVDPAKRVLSQQRVARARYLEPVAAVEAVLTNSSLIRIPAMVADRRSCCELGLDPAQLGTDDTDLWVRLLARHGLYCAPGSPAAYTVHPEAETTTLFSEAGIELLLRLFLKAQAMQCLAPDRLVRAQSHFLHQFILAGTYRCLRQRDWAGAQRVFTLFQLPALAHLHIPARWWPVRGGFKLLLMSTPWLSQPLHLPVNSAN